MNHSEINDIIYQHIKDLQEAKDAFLQRQVLEHAVPKIKLPLTIGKLKWRGIKLNIQRGIGSEIIWVEQRGKLLGEKLIITFENNF